MQIISINNKEITMKIASQYITTILTASLLSVTMVGCSNFKVNQSHLSTQVKKQLITTEPVIAYFSQDAGQQENVDDSSLDAGYSSTPVKHGFYRKLLGRDHNGRFLLQDFYQDSHKPQSDPFWIASPQGINSFDIAQTEGPITGYYENGQIAFKATYANGEAIGASQSYYNNGQLAVEETAKPDHTTFQKLWYENGQPAAEINIRVEGENDAYIYQGDIWDQQGQLIKDEEQKIEILDSIYNQIDAINP